MRTGVVFTEVKKVKTEKDLPRPGSVPLPPLPPAIKANRPKPPVSVSLAPPPPPRVGRSPQASANPSVQLGSMGFKARNDKSKRVGLAVVLLLVGVFFVGVVILVNSISGTSTINNVRAGDCLADFFSTNDNGEAEIFLVKKTDCSNLHALEVYSTTDLAYAGLTEFPGQDEAFVIGQAHCLEQFELFTGVPTEASPYEMWSLVPIPQSWAQGDRKVQCLIGSYDGVTLIEGSLRSSGMGF